MRYFFFQIVIQKCYLKYVFKVIFDINIGVWERRVIYVQVYIFQGEKYLGKFSLIGNVMLLIMIQ